MLIIKLQHPGLHQAWLCLKAIMYAGPDGSLMGKGRAIAAAMAGAIEGESTKLTDDAVVLLEQQYGPLDRNLPTGGSFGELSLADAKLARRNATIIAAEPASLIRIDKQLYRKTLYEMQVGLFCNLCLQDCGMAQCIAVRWI